MGRLWLRVRIPAHQSRNTHFENCCHIAPRKRYHNNSRSRRAYSRRSKVKFGDTDRRRNKNITSSRSETVTGRKLVPLRRNEGMIHSTRMPLISLNCPTQKRETRAHHTEEVEECIWFQRPILDGLQGVKQVEWGYTQQTASML